MKKHIITLHLLTGLLLTVTGISLTLYLRDYSPQLTRPTGQVLSATTTYITPKPREKRIVMAFLPFWLIDEVKDLDIPPITHLAYFGLEFDGQGNLRTQIENGAREPGFNHYWKEPFSQVVRKVKDQNGKVLLVLRMMQNDDIDSALQSPQARERIVTQTVNTLRQKNLDGINVDFEYVGTPAPSTIRNFTLFLSSLKSACPTCELSVDVYADAASNSRIWDIPSVSQVSDYIVIMGYDFFRQSSTNAGPVSPLRGACKASLENFVKTLIQPQPNCLYNYDLTSSVRDHLQLVPREKLILAVPFYGYEWPTSTTIPGSPATDRGTTAPYKKIVGLLSTLKLLNQPFQTAIHPSSLTPYLIWNSKSQPIQIWYDNPQSLSLKRQLVDNSDLAGIAAWAWGYDDDAGELWKAISN